MPERIGMRELARRLGCAPSHVHKLKMRGVLVFGEDGLIEEETAWGAIEAARDPQKDYVRERYAGNRPEAPPPPGQSPGQVSDNSTYHRAKAAREAIEARRAQVELERLMGELVPVADVKREYFAIVREMRDALLALPDRVAQVLAIESDPRGVHRVLSEEIEQVLHGLSREFSAEDRTDPSPSAPA